MRIHDSETNKCKKKLMLEPKEFEQGIEYALANDCDGLQIDTWNIDDDAVMDFKLFEKVANQIVFLSITNINTTNVANFEYIYSLERLETFYCQQVDLHIDFTRFSSLRNIGIFYNKNFLNLDKLEQLESAVISKLTEKDMSLFSNWKSIKTLHIYQSQIECLKGIEDLIQIDTLVFAHNRKLIDISSINRLDYIGEVSFEKNSKLRDYSVLADNQNIHNLFISDLDDLKFIQSMKSLLSFRFWNCKNGDLSPLLGNPILKDVYFTPNKKHYSHTLEQIKILITKRDNAYSVPHLTLSTIKHINMYEEFLEKSLNNKRQAVDDTFIAKYADLSYPELNILWQEVGLGSYCNGLFKLINPSDYQDVINSCYEKEDDKSFLPFMCTAFGDVFAYVKNPRLNNYVVYLNVRYGTYLILPANLRAIFNKVMVNQSFLKGWFDLENYPVIQEKLGTPDYDECFGYSLLLAMGGSEDIENIKIVKTIPYIDICTQTIGEFEVADKY
jgi:hypothetical protein